MPDRHVPSVVEIEAIAACPQPVLRNLRITQAYHREFARFLPVARGPIGTFGDGLRPGDPPEGQRLLVAAFRGYQRARRLTGPGQRAECMLLANLQIGLHEQTRLQPEIAEALNTAVPEPQALAQRVLDALVPPSDRVRTRVRRTILDRVLAPVLDQIRGRVRGAITAELMTLALPDAVLRLGRDVTGQFPPALLRLTDPELTAFLQAVDPTPDTPLGSGTQDWAMLPDRMHFIADLFRTRHEDATLHRPPFSPAQLRAIADGRTPDGDF